MPFISFPPFPILFPYSLVFPGITSQISGRTRAESQLMDFQSLCLQPLNSNASELASDPVSDNNLEEGCVTRVIGCPCSVDLSTIRHLLLDFHIGCESTQEPQLPG